MSDASRFIALLVTVAVAIAAIVAINVSQAERVSKAMPWVVVLAGLAVLLLAVVSVLR